MYTATFSSPEVACVDEVVLGLSQLGSGLSGSHMHGVRTCSLLGSVSSDSIPAGPLTGTVADDQVTIIGTLNPSGRTDTLRGTLSGDGILGGSWTLTRVVLTIAEAKQLPGLIVTVEGAVTIAQGVFRLEGDDAYLQDQTGGLKMFGLDPSLRLASGERVRVVGRMGSFAGEQEIVSLDQSTRPKVARLGTTSIPSPRATTVDEVNSRLYEGELASVSSVHLALPPDGTTGAYSVFLSNSTQDTVVVRIHAGVERTLPRTFWSAGPAYTITGALGSFQARAQLQPRSMSDVIATP